MVRIAVIGAGYLGRFHIEKLKNIKGCSLEYVCEINKKSSAAIKNEFNVKVLNDYRELIGKVDAVSIVTPTPTHYEIADFFLENNVHVFIEKPVTDDLSKAKKILKKRKKKIVVQVGYIERFNPAFRFLSKHIKNPVSVIFRRKSPFSPRGSDVDVVLDLMIHDIDLAMNIFKNHRAKILSVKGSRIFTDHNDIINAVIKFDDVTAVFDISRAFHSKERKITVLEENAYIEADLLNQTGYMLKHGKELRYEEGKKDILYEELSSFIMAINKKEDPVVSLEDGINSLKLAQNILKKAEK